MLGYQDPWATGYERETYQQHQCEVKCSLLESTSFLVTESMETCTCNQFNHCDPYGKASPTYLVSNEFVDLPGVPDEPTAMFFSRNVTTDFNPI